MTATLNQTSDPEEQKQIIIQIETILWNDLATIPVVRLPRHRRLRRQRRGRGVQRHAVRSDLEHAELEPLLGQ